MSRFRPLALCLATLTGLMLTASAGRADVFTGTMYFTTFQSGGDHVHYADYSYDSTAKSFNLVNSAPGNVAIHNVSTPGVNGGDGIIFAKDGSLLVGGQSNNVYNVTVNTANDTGHLVQTYTNSGVGTAYHLALDPTGTIIYAGGTEGGTTGLVKDNTSNGNYFTKTVTGSNDSITGIAFDSLGNAYYTSSNDSGGGSAFGTISGLGGTGTATTTALVTNTLNNTTGTTFTAAHGIIYDSFTGDFFLVGDHQIVQVQTDGTIVGHLNFGTTGRLGFSNTFDQGSTDGQGHLFVANNDGNLLVIDYSQTGNIQTTDLNTDAYKVFLATDLDDIAPLAAGQPGGPPAAPEPGSLALLGIGAVGLLGYRWRSKRGLKPVEAGSGGRRENP